MGTPEFAVPCLEILYNAGYEIAAVVTVADKPAGRGQSLSQSAVKQFAVSKGLKVLQPLKLKDPGFLNELSTLKADLQVVVAFRMLPEAVWDMPPLGTINLHASLLPAYRGAAPINWAIINGEKETGLTTFKLQHEIDSGQILFQEKIKIEEGETAGVLHDKMKTAGATLLLKTVREIEDRTQRGEPLPLVVQEESRVSHAPKIFKETCRVRWDEPAQKIHNLVRGLSPYPAAFAILVNEGRQYQLKIFSAATEPGKTVTPGAVDSDGKTSLKVQCAEGCLVLLEIQLEGKKRMRAEEFLRGFKMAEDCHFI